MPERCDRCLGGALGALEVLGGQRGASEEPRGGLRGALEVTLKVFQRGILGASEVPERRLRGASEATQRHLVPCDVPHGCHRGA